MGLVATDKEMTMGITDTERDSGPQVYVACVAAYNGGTLHGAWIHLWDNEKKQDEEIQAMLATSPEPDAEEWRIDDHEGLCGIGSGASLEDCRLVADLVLDHDEDVVTAALSLTHYVEEAKELVEDKHEGAWDSLGDWAHDYMSNCGNLEEGSLVERYFDYDSFGRDCEMAGDISSVRVGGQVHVFSGL